MILVIVSVSVCVCVQEMASAELKQIREALTKESIREHQLSKVGGTETDMFICSKCHGKNCTYTQVLTHTRGSLDEVWMKVLHHHRVCVL